MRNIGARSWQILVHEDPPEPAPLDEVPLHLRVVGRPPNALVEIRLTTPGPPTPILRLAAAVAVDMASAHLPLVEQLANLMIDYPYEENETKDQISNRIIRLPDQHLVSRDPAWLAGVSLAKNRWEKAILHSIVALVEPYRLTVTMPNATSYFRLPRHSFDTGYAFAAATRKEIEGLQGLISYWAGVWWAEVRDVLAFIGEDFK